MFGKRIPLFTLFGFEVGIDASWFILAVLIVWSLAVGLFPMLHPDLSTATYWWMAVAGALGLFASIVLHEFAHALVARRNGLPMRGITLFIFGGVAEMDREPPSAKAECLMAIAGPIASVLIALACFGLNVVGAAAGWPAAVNGVLAYLWFINGLLVVFNLIPAFPLDGGRVLRSALWHFKGDLRWATRVTSTIGAGFGILLILWGVVTFIMGSFIAGVWWFLIGLFLRGAANMSYQQLLVRRALEGEPVRRFMHAETTTVPPDATVAEFVDDYVYRHHYKMFPVASNGQLQGCVTTRKVKELPREEWSEKTVGQIAEPCSPENTISPDADALHALAMMHRTGASRLLVVDGGRLAGIITLKDLVNFIALKVDLDLN